jgi:hypothetical protein
MKSARQCAGGVGEYLPEVTGELAEIVMVVVGPWRGCYDVGSRSDSATLPVTQRQTAKAVAEINLR